ncbi:MAG: B12-binding domain-containing radical SAM protein [Chloroflexi bacterium]|nr:B12-binding domain-containing radical SAM protein [Chloroflexota bacterium]
MSQVLFGQAYYLRFDPKLLAARQPYPPLGTLYAASYIREHGYDIALFDAILADSEEEWRAALAIERPRFAVIYEDNFNYLSKMCLLRMREAAFTMARMAKEAACTVIVAGSDVSDHWQSYLEAGADYAIIGEGEIALRELLDWLTGVQNGPAENVLGLAFLVDGRPVVTGHRPEIKDLDTLPRPAWDLVDIERYRSIWMESHGYFSLNMVTTRGCPFHCNWCAKPIWGQRYHARSPRSVVEEMGWLQSRYGVDHVWFADDILGLKPGWLEEFGREVQTAGLQLPFKCLGRADLLLRGGEIAALQQAGCQIVWIGAESGSQKILDAMDKGTRIDQIAEAAARLRRHGIQVGFFLQFGYPGETWADIQSTLELVRKCAPDDIGISVSYPLPGTKFHEAVRSQLGEKRNWDNSSDLAMMYAGPFSTAFYRRLHARTHAEFRLRKYGREFWNGRDRSARRFLQIGKLALEYPFQVAALAWQRHKPHRGIAPISGGMPSGAAAIPTPQDD